MVMSASMHTRACSLSPDVVKACCASGERYLPLASCAGQLVAVERHPADEYWHARSHCSSSRALAQRRANGRMVKSSRMSELIRTLRRR
jgi:hypothetical protein